MGNHLVVDCWKIKNNLDTVKAIKNLLITAALKANATILKSTFYKFHPQGITGVVLLSESHISIHTWPERQYASIDIYTCGNHTKPSKAISYIKRQLKPGKIRIQIVSRGLILQKKNKDLKFN